MPLVSRAIPAIPNPPITGAIGIESSERIIKIASMYISVITAPTKTPDNVFDLFAQGNTIGIFLFESNGMQEYLKQLKLEIEKLKSKNN